MSTDKNLMVYIVGNANTGKTSAAYVISQALKGYGAKFTVQGVTDNESVPAPAKMHKALVDRQITIQVLETNIPVAEPVAAPADAPETEQPKEAE